jgi:hypothetical protein
MVLISAFTKAVSDYNRMQIAQVTALARGTGSNSVSRRNRLGKRSGLRGPRFSNHERKHGCDAALTTGSGVYGDASGLVVTRG